MHKLRLPTPKQIELAKSIGLDPRDKSFRVLSAEISDALEVKSFDVVGSEGIRLGTEVEYIGSRNDMLRHLLVSAVGKNGYLYFKGTHSYCRPYRF